MFGQASYVQKGFMSLRLLHQMFIVKLYRSFTSIKVRCHTEGQNLISTGHKNKLINWHDGILFTFLAVLFIPHAYLTY